MSWWTGSATESICNSGGEKGTGNRRRTCGNILEGVPERMSGTAGVLHRHGWAQLMNDQHGLGSRSRAEFQIDPVSRDIV